MKKDDALITTYMSMISEQAGNGVANHIRDLLAEKNIPKNIADRLNGLSMLPGDWRDLDRLLSHDEYRDVVNDYQHREHKALPRCTSLFKVCIYSHGGKCTAKNRHCPYQKY